MGGVKGWVVLELGRPPKMFKRGSTGKKGGQGCGAGPRGEEMGICYHGIIGKKGHQVVLTKQKTNTDVIKAAASVLERYGRRVRFAYLFGSVARGDSGSGSDFDLAVYFTYGSPAELFDLQLSLCADLCRALKRNDVDIVVLNTASNLMLLDEIVRHGIVLRDSDQDGRRDFELRTLHRSLDFRSQRLLVMGV